MGIAMRALIVFSIAALSGTTAAFAAEADYVLFEEPRQYEQAEYEAYKNQAISGFAEGSFAHNKGESGGFEADGNTWALRGAVNAELSTNINVQVDGGYSRTSVNGVEVNTLIGAAHAYYRQPDQFAVGAFVQGARLGSNYLDLLAPLGADRYATDYVGGGEAAVFMDRATLYGQLGFGKADYSGFDADHLMVEAGLRLYATDNLRLDGEAAFNRLSIAGGDVDVQSYSATGNYRFSDVPVTAFAGYRYDRASLNAGDAELGTANAHNIMTGLRFHFGSGSLKDEERKGPVWNSSAPLL
jgi:hypothetical protein